MNSSNSTIFNVCNVIFWHLPSECKMQLYLNVNSSNWKKVEDISPFCGATDNPVERKNIDAFALTTRSKKKTVCSTIKCLLNKKENGKTEWSFLSKRERFCTQTDYRDLYLQLKWRNCDVWRDLDTCNVISFCELHIRKTSSTSWGYLEMIRLVTYLCQEELGHSSNHDPSCCS